MINAYSSTHVTIDYVAYKILSQDSFALFAESSTGTQIVLDKLTHKCFTVKN